jgi:hypothetical protein
MRVQRDVARAKSRNVFAHMVAVSKDPSAHLAMPTPGELARHRKVRTSKSKDKSRGRGKSSNKRTITTIHASVLCTSLRSPCDPDQRHAVSQVRLKEFPKQPFSLCGPNGSKLFCDACTCEVSLVKSSITDHISRPKHTTNIEMKAHMKKDAARIEQSMESLHKEVAFSLPDPHLSHTITAGTPGRFHRAC